MTDTKQPAPSEPHAYVAEASGRCVTCGVYGALGHTLPPVSEPRTAHNEARDLVNDYFASDGRYPDSEAWATLHGALDRAVIEAEAATPPAEVRLRAALRESGLWPGALERLLFLIGPEYAKDSLVGLAVQDVRSLVVAALAAEGKQR